jgi:hypothetical protein
MPMDKKKGTTKKVSDDEKINITIDPALKAEMLAEARKTPEQRQADKDQLFALMGNMMVEYGREMIPKPKPVPLKKPESPENDNPEFLEIY